MDAALATIEADAREFGLHDRQGAWRMGLLVARSVQVDKGSGRRDDRPSDAHETLGLGKVSARDFALMSGTSAKRVMKYYRAWEKAAKEGLVKPASELNPGDELNTLLWDRLPDWGKYYEKEQRPEVGTAPRLYPPSAPRKAEDRSENTNLPSMFCGYPTGEEQIDLVESQLRILLSRQYDLRPKSLERIEQILLEGLEEVRSYDQRIRENSPSAMG
jgi:hypothetical protein